MDPVTIILALMLAVVVFALLATKIGVPYPTMMVLGGLAICVVQYFVQKVPRFEIEPRLIFTVFLPPLLYGAAWQTSWKDIRSNLRPILLMAVGLVLFTTAGVAMLAMHFVPGFTWASAFALGAIVSPPDAIAVTALTKSIRLPRRVVFLLEGESLVNDASALVALKFAIAAAMTGTFSLVHASGEFVLVSMGGIVLGLLIGWIVAELHLLLNDTLIETMITFLTPYTAYLIGEEIGVSGVLATVVAGLYVSWRAPEVLTPPVRLRATAVWEFVLFLLNGFVFVLLGLGLPAVLKELPEHSPWRLAWYGLVLVMGMIVLRIVWIFIGAYLPFLSKRVRRNETIPPVRDVALLGWTGMRGVVSLAAALSLPLLTKNNADFPNRGMIIYLAFFTILFTLVAQSLTLPLVVKLLRIQPGTDEQAEEREARLLAMRAAVSFLKDLTDSTDAFGEVGTDMLADFEHRLHHMETGAVPLPVLAAGIEASSMDLHREALSAQRQALVDLRARQKISTEAFGRLMSEVDSEELHLPTRH